MGFVIDDEEVLSLSHFAKDFAYIRLIALRFTFVHAPFLLDLGFAFPIQLMPVELVDAATLPLAQLIFEARRNDLVAVPILCSRSCGGDQKDTFQEDSFHLSAHIQQ